MNELQEVQLVTTIIGIGALMLSVASIVNLRQRGDKKVVNYFPTVVLLILSIMTVVLGAWKFYGYLPGFTGYTSEEIADLTYFVMGLTGMFGGLAVIVTWPRYADRVFVRAIAAFTLIVLAYIGVAGVFFG